MSNRSRGVVLDIETFDYALGDTFEPIGSRLRSTKLLLSGSNSMVWHGNRGDEAVFVLGGEVEIDGERCAARSGIVIEAGAVTVLRAATNAHLLRLYSVVGPSWQLIGPPLRRGGIHVTPPVPAPRPGDSPTQHFFADSYCDSCRINVFQVSAGQRITSYSHYHSEDEIIFVLDGKLLIAQQRVGEGSSVFVPAGRRYRLTTRSAFSYVNFRPDASTVTIGSRRPPVLEPGRDGGVPERYVAAYEAGAANTGAPGPQKET